MRALILRHLIIVVYMFFVCGCAIPWKQVASPLITDMTALKEVKKNPTHEKQFRVAKAQGDRHLGEDIIIVIDKFVTFAELNADNCNEVIPVQPSNICA